jgi:uncharacterized protein involved in exopolysaccharide biosynthesis
MTKKSQTSSEDYDNHLASDKNKQDNHLASENESISESETVSEFESEFENNTESENGYLYHAVVYGSHLSTKQRRSLYFKVFFISCIVVWTLILTFVTLKPDTYTSQWSLILPGTGNGHAVSLESIGQATATSSSPYNNSSISPSVNYKAIATSTPVLVQAAATVGISLSEFSKPRITLVDQTSLMNFEIKGSSAKQSQLKALALYNSLQFQLERLRNDEQKVAAQSSLKTLEGFSKKLENAQQEKLVYQTKSGILSLEQFNQLVVSLENKRTTVSDLLAQLQNLVARSNSLQNILGLSKTQLIQAVNLRNDTMFQEYIKRHADVHAQIATTEGAWGKNHPKLKQLETSHHSINEAIKLRGRKLAGDKKTNVWTLIEIGSTQFENGIFQDLIQLNSQKNGLAKEIEALTSTIKDLELRIKRSSSDAIKIEDLGRKQQVATAVFSTALAKQEIGRADRFASYPQVQILAQPSLPEEADKIVVALALAGGSLATFSIAIGLVLLWLRKPWLQKILKNE